jgi:Protein of unknown function (DUF3891)
MILQDRGDHLLVIRQTDHGVLSGFFARAWGNDHFARPELLESFCLAVREHDNGWAEWELEPELDPKTRIPYTFMSIPTEQHVALYLRGIERLVDVDRYAALLVSLHCSGLYDRARATMPGFSAKYVKSSESQLVNDFLQKLKLQQLRLKVDLRTNPATKVFAEEKSLERYSRLLESLDRLSLCFCMNTLESVTIDDVPLSGESEAIDWVLRSGDNNGVILAPYPFRKSPLEVSILARRLPKCLYGNNLDFQRALALAPYFALNFTLLAANAADEARGAVA